jgi:hypothetical protein
LGLFSIGSIAAEAFPTLHEPFYPSIDPEWRPAMLTCVIRYHIDPMKKDEFTTYARNWGQAIPRCGAELIGYYAPHEGSSTLAYGMYNIPSLSEYEAYRARLAADPLGRENYLFAQREKLLLREDRTFLKCVSLPHGEKT